MIVSVMYQVGDGQKFDLGYYMKTHMPLVSARFGSFGMKGWQVLQGAGTPTGDLAGYQIITLLDFGSADEFKAAAGAHGTEIFGDIPNFTDTSPAVQFNNVLS